MDITPLVWLAPAHEDAFKGMPVFGGCEFSGGLKPVFLLEQSVGDDWWCSEQNSWSRSSLLLNLPMSGLSRTPPLILKSCARLALNSLKKPIGWRRSCRSRYKASLYASVGVQPWTIDTGGCSNLVCLYWKPQGREPARMTDWQAVEPNGDGGLDHKTNHRKAPLVFFSERREGILHPVQSVTFAWQIVPHWQQCYH